MSRYHTIESQQPLRLARDFQARPGQEREIFTQQTWCDSCEAGHLGMLEPVEYQEGERIFLEGKCYRCGSPVISEIIDGNTGKREVDIIWPIKGRFPRGLTKLPRKSFYSHFEWGETRYSYSPLQTIHPASRAFRALAWPILSVIAVSLIACLAWELMNGH